MRMKSTRPSPSMSSTRQAVDRLLVERIAPRRRADVARPVGERELGAVGVQARAEVDRARVEQLRDLSASLPCRRRRPAGAGSRAPRSRGQLGGVDVAVGPERRLVGGGAGGDVGDGRDPDVAALVALADRAHRHQRRVRLGVVEQQPGQRRRSGRRCRSGVRAWRAGVESCRGAIRSVAAAHGSASERARDDCTLHGTGAPSTKTLSLARRERAPGLVASSAAR